MAFDSAQFLRHSPAVDRMDRLYPSEPLSAAHSPVEVGRAMGMAVVAEPGASAKLQDAMEELSMQFEEKAAKKLSERRLGETRRTAYVASIEAWEKTFPDLPDRSFVEKMLRDLRQAARNGVPPDADAFLGELAAGSKDPSHQFAMLEIIRAALGDGEENLRAFTEALGGRIVAERGAEVAAGINLAREINVRASTPEEMQSLRDLYRGEVIGFTTPHDCYRSLISSRGADALAAAIDFLLAGCGADIQSPSPSRVPEELRRIMLDLQCVQVLRTVLDRLSSLSLRMDGQFGEKCRLDGGAMTGRVLDFTERPFVSERDIGVFVGECGISGLPAKMDFCREIISVFRQLSPRLFTSEDDRVHLVEAAQEHLDGLVALEDAQEVPEGGAEHG